MKTKNVLVAALIILSLTGLFAGGLPAADSPPQNAKIPATGTALIDLIVQRLELARDVAWAKYNTGASIYDSAREAELRKSLVAKAAEVGLAPSAATAFFTAQIAASRQVQAELIDGWKNGAAKPSAKPLNLLKDIRPRLNTVTDQILVALASQPDWPGDPVLIASAQTALHAHGFSEATSKLAVQGLLGESPQSP